ncbi:unnamed protein product [Mytilus coruscus]|uniref:Retrotransposon gag domain-containing protein n=1 Tax=Mytilus coruscus TaxID=42192 RepID=A0A6J8EXS2_MYTCO|nr:unnamed protein product [Mytilus coruscus]
MVHLKTKNFGRIPHSSGENHRLSNIKSNSNTAAYKANNTSQIHFGGERQRFCPPERETAYRCEFRDRRRRRDESVSNYGYSLKRLAAHAFPTIPLNIRESLIIEQYISGLANPELKRHVQFSHPTTLDRAISLALEFEAFEGSQISPVIKKPQDEDLISPICTSINVK